MTDCVIARRALVTGATGFVGSRLVRRLVAEGWLVTAILREQSRTNEIDSVLSGIHVVRMSGVRDLDSAISEASPDVVFHLASKFLAEHRSEDVGDLIDSNIRFGAQLLESMARNGVFRLVNAGTSWQHFGTAADRPVCLYAATKQAFESIMDYYIDARSLRPITLKLFDTYGPNDPRRKLFFALRGAIGSKIPVPFSAGEQLVDLVYIDDVINAFLVAANRLIGNESAAREEYAVSSAAPCSLRDLAKIYASALGVELKIAWGARPYREREVMLPWAAGKSIPGWRPQVSLEEGIVLTERGRI